LIDATDPKTVGEAIKGLIRTRWDKEKLLANARKFSKERFTSEIRSFVKRYA
jgi:hypothetical protein